MLILQGNDEQKAQGRQVLADVLECMRIVAVLLSPIAPQLSQRMYLQLGFSEDQFKSLTLSDSQWGGMPSHARSLISWASC